MAFSISSEDRPCSGTKHFESPSFNTRFSSGLSFRRLQIPLPSSTLTATFFQRAHLSPPATILYCRCAYAQVVPTGVKNDVLQKLCDSNASFETVSDLCEMAAHRDPRLKAIASCGKLRIAACYPRAVKGLFQQAGSPLPEEAEILNMRTQTAQEIAEALLKAEA